MDKEEKINMINAIKSGDQKSFTKMYNAYKPKVNYYIYSIIKNTEITNDLVSITFTKIFQNIQKYVNDVSFDMWVKTIATNTAIDYIRKNQKNEQNQFSLDAEENFMQIDDVDNSAEDIFLQKEFEKTVEESISKLKKKYRDVLLLRMSGKSYEDIAKTLNLTDSQTKSYLNKARTKLKKTI